MNSRLALFALPIMIAFVLGGCNKTGGNLATVAGDPLTKDEFLEYLQTKANVRVTVQGNPVDLPVVDTLAFQAMQDMISRKIMMQLAKDEKVAPTEKEVDDEIGFRKKLNENFIKQLQSRGMTMGLIRRNIEIELAQEKLLTKGITVTDAEVEEYITNNKSQFMDPPQMDADWIFVKADTKKAVVDKALREGQSFRSVAKTTSDAPNAAASEGKFALKNMDGLSPQLRAIIDKTEVGKQTEWIAADGGFAKFQVNSKTPGKPVEMTPARKEFLKRQIAISRGQKANDLGRRIQERLRTADIKIQDPALKDIWSAFEDKLKSDAKDAKLPVPTGGTDSKG